MNNKKGLYADIGLFVAAIIWGGAFVAAKGALDSIKPFEIITMRFGIATILMIIVFWKKLKSIKKNDIIAGTVIGLFLFVGYALQTIGLQYTTAGKQSFLTGTYVVIVPFLYWGLTKKSPDKYSMIATIITFIGISFLTLDGGFSISFGDTLTLFCALVFAGQIIAIDFYTKKHDPIILTIVQITSVAILSLISSLIFEGKIELSLIYKNPYILFLGVFCTFLAFIIQNVAQKYTTSTHAAILLSLESLFGSIFAVVVLNENFTFKMVIGCILIFIAIITAETKWSFLPFKSTEKAYAE